MSDMDLLTVGLPRLVAQIRAETDAELARRRGLQEDDGFKTGAFSNQSGIRRTDARHCVTKTPLAERCRRKSYVQSNSRRDSKGIYQPVQHRPEPGEVLLKEFLISEAARLGISTNCLYTRIQRGKYPGLRIRRVNSWWVFVRSEAI